MLFCGMLPMIISHFIVLPYAGPTPLMQNDTASLQSNFPYEKKKESQQTKSIWAVSSTDSSSEWLDYQEYMKLLENTTWIFGDDEDQLMLATNVSRPLGRRH